ncbi:type I-C CRISPR-associated protein Cas5c [Thiocapsa roseopersicina]|uniref:pre-crRNA processing endonuclease n=1 Tax=Thiocapsa roseopersicina TaxID=1058 RepID=A0A1H2XPI8_THIRO|nr:type I-C CRISPR-associated protein Cas5c [Thiocapsa roseopersicina]SDW94715.1 CRISPR-associated protein, Cas5d family [Thiocapsa roseopersicina]
MVNGTHTLEVWGDFACFTRPEMKVERFSYPVITPSAARGIFDAIYWDARREGDRVRPYFHWQITRVEVLEPPRYIALRRNEVKDRVPGTAVLNKWMRGAANPEPLWADGGKDELGTDKKGRTQRQTMALKNVRYRLTARIVPKPAFAAERGAMNSQFQRRARAGKCFQQPYFGCREFPAFFEYLDEPVAAAQPPIPLDQHLGLMLYDVFDLSRESVKDGERPFISLFDATLVAGVLEIPPFDSDAVKKPGGI